MGHILSLIRREKIECLPCAPVNLDYQRFTEYTDSDEHPAEGLFERNGDSRSTVAIGSNLPAEGPSILRYFLDGSRRTYKVADVIVKGRFLPLIAGQVGVAVVERSDQTIRPLRKYSAFQPVIAFPDEVTSEDDPKVLEGKIRAAIGHEFQVVRYAVKRDRDPVDLGVARIMRAMQDLEVAAVGAMSKDNLLANDSMLVIDGPLRFREMRDRRFDIVQFRNVVGLSKTFQPSYSLGKGSRRMDVGSIASRLAFAERSRVFRTDADEDKRIGMWYLRIRRSFAGGGPLQGVVKPELYAIDPEERDDGLDCERVNVISAHILRERNATPYGKDSRWASHIYPIYMAERFIKDSLLSDVHFMAMF